MHESTRIEPSYVSVEARELKASSWPAGLRTEVCATSERKRGRGARRVRGEVRREEKTLWLQSRSREELGGGGQVHYRLYSAFLNGGIGKRYGGHGDTKEGTRRDAAQR